MLTGSTFGETKAGIKPIRKSWRIQISNPEAKVVQSDKSDTIFQLEVIQISVTVLNGSQKAQKYSAILI